MYLSQHGVDLLSMESGQIPMVPEANTIAEMEKRRAAWSSVLAAVFLTLLKVIVGLMTGSLGILAEAAHSGLDLVAALVTLFAVRYSDQPPDTDHLYGHGKMEHLSALIETLLLLATCVWIMYEAIQRLFFKTAHVEANIWAFLVMAVSVAVDVSRSRMLYRTARKYNSQALEADALHFSTDIWSSLTVIVGLALVRLSEYLGSEWAWLAQADAVAAMVVALIVVIVSLRLGRRAVSALLDAAPPGLAERIASEVASVTGVEAVETVRVRQSGAATFADLVVGVDRSASLQEAHQIAAAVESKVLALLPEIDVVVHVDPIRETGESLPKAVSAIASRFGLQTHKVHAHELHGDYFLDLDVELPGDLTLEKAHARVTRFEAALYQELPYIKEINTHIEPISTSTVLSAGRQLESPEELRAQVSSLVKEFPQLRGCHNIRVLPGRDGFDIVVHCHAGPGVTLAEAHQLAEQLEKKLLAQQAGINQVHVHLEPEQRAPTLGPDDQA